MKPIHANFMSFVLKLYIYISLSHGILDAKTILKMQPVHANFMSVVLGLYMYHGFLDTRII